MPDLTHLAVGDEVMLCEQRCSPRPVTVASVGRLYLTVRGARGRFRRHSGANKEGVGLRYLTTREGLADGAERDRLRTVMRDKGLSQAGVQTLTADQLRRIIDILEEGV
ncbi:hypothetical protein [Streptomyces sp. NTK 937]|uniref:beta barrel domain-containing protein n=1 Tax=Streptomyces sp. NTK 937 TaxID=1487711 RepID=UPI0004A91D52|nr:hypothetical protein [Streptomyces sp. NTK 937]KDQ65736.1 hypothetical protein DT87_00325 [Streptomyces sp. NTK 937]